MLNEMMHRPVIQENVLELMRTRQKKLDGKLGNIEKKANELGIPIIPHETVVFMQFLLGQLKPQRILEIGTAIGFSAGLMALTVGDNCQITTIDRFDKMIERAKTTFHELNIEDQVTLLEGQASEILPILDDSYDFIFLDCAKAKYIEFLPRCLQLLKVGGVIMIDDVFQAGTIMESFDEIPRSQRSIYRHLNELMDSVLTHPCLTSTLVPLGDGVLLITKDEAFEFKRINE